MNNNVFKQKEISNYFKARKRVGTKVVKATVPKDKWDVIREYGMFRGCPSTLVEDALVCFAVDSAYEEAKKHENDRDFLEWQQRRSGFYPSVATEELGLDE